MGTGFPVWSWMLQEPEVHDDQLKYKKKKQDKIPCDEKYQSAFLTVDGKKYLSLTVDGYSLGRLTADS